MMAISSQKTQALNIQFHSAKPEIIDLRKTYDLESLDFGRFFRHLDAVESYSSRKERAYKTKSVFSETEIPNVSEFFETIELCSNNKAVAALAEYGFDVRTASAIASVINVKRPLHLVQQLPKDLEDLASGRPLGDAIGFSVNENKSDLGEFSKYFGNLLDFYTSSLNKKLPGELDLVVRVEERIRSEENVGVGYLPGAEGERLSFSELQESAILLLYSKYLQKTATPEKSLQALKLIGKLQARLAGKEPEFLSLEDKITLQHYERKVFHEDNRGEKIAEFLGELQSVPAIYLMQWDPQYVMKPPHLQIEIPKNITLYAIVPTYVKNERTKLGEVRRRGIYKNTKPLVASMDVPSELIDLMSAYWFYNFKQMTSNEADESEKKKACKPYKQEVYNIIYRHRNTPWHTSFDFYDKSGESLGEYHVKLSKYGHYGIPITEENGKGTELRFDVYNSDGHKKILSLKRPAVWEIVKNFRD
ncbi:MAG TPA: hypothetical protein VJ110_03735 [Candidatus Nanoarchaeia archaeon]|nr:hypothetical protein [Candidatus Nanoarchaeia archaeon]